MLLLCLKFHRSVQKRYRPIRMRVQKEKCEQSSKQCNFLNKLMREYGVTLTLFFAQTHRTKYKCANSFLRRTTVLAIASTSISTCIPTHTHTNGFECEIFSTLSNTANDTININKNRTWPHHAMDPLHMHVPAWIRDDIVSHHALVIREQHNHPSFAKFKSRLKANSE